MKRSAPLRRKTPLTRNRTKRIRPLRRKTMEPGLRRLVYLRANGRCDCCGAPLHPDAWDAHHRQLRARGGKDTLANLIALRHDHHMWAHEHPAEAKERGLMVSAYANPEDVPVLLHGTRWSLARDTWDLTHAPDVQNKKTGV